MTTRYPAPPTGTRRVPWLDEAVNQPDETAIHKSRPGEIKNIPEKTSPVSGDLIVVEDSADNNEKKRVQLGNIPTNALAGSWTTWTPTYSNFTIGNGTVTARYTQIGKLVVFYFNWVWGSTSSIDGANATISAPVEASSSYPDGDMPLGTARYQETGTAARMGYVRLETTTTLRPVVNSATTTYVRDAGITSTVPFTWGNTDVMSLQGVYEAA